MQIIIVGDIQTKKDIVVVEVIGQEGIVRMIPEMIEIDDINLIKSLKITQAEDHLLIIDKFKSSWFRSNILYIR